MLSEFLFKLQINLHIPKILRTFAVQLTIRNYTSIVMEDFSTKNMGEIVLYQTEDGVTKLNVHLQDESVWLSQDQIAELYQRDKSVISRHIRNIFAEGELEEKEVVAFFATTSAHGAIEGLTQTHMTAFYNLDVIT